MAMNFARLQNGREISADDISDGIIRSKNEYIEICEDCLINNYWDLDNRYHYDYGYKLGINLRKCAFRDIEKVESNCPICKADTPEWVLKCHSGLCMNCAVKRHIRSDKINQYYDTSKL